MLGLADPCLPPPAPALLPGLRDLLGGGGDCLLRFFELERHGGGTFHALGKLEKGLSWEFFSACWEQVEARLVAAVSYVEPLVLTKALDSPVFPSQQL